MLVTHLYILKHDGMVVIISRDFERGSEIEFRGVNLLSRLT
jgi:hypothetical protein